MEHSGLVMGICIGGYGISSTMWSPIQLAIANPNNVEAVTPPGSEEAYFEDEDVLKRMPIINTGVTHPGTMDGTCCAQPTICRPMQ